MSRFLEFIVSILTSPIFWAVLNKDSISRQMNYSLVSLNHQHGSALGLLFPWPINDVLRNPLSYLWVDFHMLDFTDSDIDRIIEMAWEDRTPFEAISYQFSLTEAEVIALMRQELKASSFKRWRKRVNSGVSLKHRKKRKTDIDRFKSTRQRSISMNKISKR